MNSGTPAPRLHLVAAVCAVVTASVALAAGLVRARSLERTHIHALAGDFSNAKLQGVALQREAFSRDDLLPLYGSSELVKEVPNKASDFFVDYPTGFRVFPVGKAGATALPVLHKLVAVGRELRGRKLAISLSPSSYFAEEVDAGYYGGNFSELHATELAFSTAISRGLKRDAARRMLEYPKTIEDNWLLQTALRRLAGDTALDRALYAALFPLGKLQLWIGRAQDHFEAAEHIEDIHAPLAAEKRPRKMNWAATLRQAGEIAKKMKATAKKPGAPALAKRPKGSRDKAWLATLEKADEWTDFELVLRALEELGARPLILSMPVHGEDLENFGVSKTARSAYEDRMRGLTGRYHAPFVYFKQNEEDPNFFYDNLDHLSPSGWIYYNKMLDDFFHERLTTLEPQPIPPRL